MPLTDSTAPMVWSVGALCRAVANALDARFNPVSVSGEIGNVSRAASGHMYFSLKDDAGQLRCAMFRRAASALTFAPAEGDRVEVRGRLSVYEPRGDLQLVVESMARAGQGTLFEQFLALKAKLESEGLFDPSRKRPIPDMPSQIGLVTSLGAAALHDVVTALERRLPHVRVMLSPASVQGASAPGELMLALEALYREARKPGAGLDVILVVRGGGSLEDLWAFNDERLARTIANSPVPVISGVGHETDFTIADFVADLRAPTPTAAAELAGTANEVLQRQLDGLHQGVEYAVLRRLERESQRLDLLAAQIARPSSGFGRYARQLDMWGHRLATAVSQSNSARKQRLQGIGTTLPALAQRCAERKSHALAHLETRLRAVDPRQVLQRGYALLAKSDGASVTTVAQLAVGESVRATLIDGTVDLSVRGTSAE